MSVFITNTAPQLLLRDMSIVWSNWNTVPLLLDSVYERRITKHPFEIVQEMGTLPSATPKPQSSAGTILNMAPGYQAAYTPIVYTSFFQMSREMIDDNQYASEWPQQNKNLRNSMESNMNIQAMMPFNNGFDPSKPLGDGVPLFSTQHPTAVGVQANTFTNFVGLNLSSLKELITISRFTTNYAGQNINIQPHSLIINPNLEFDAREILGSPDRPDTANRSVNSLYTGSYIPGGCQPNPFLSIPTFWMFTTNQEPGNLWYDRDSIEITWQGDQNVDVMTFKGRNRFANGPANWRANYGSA